MSRFSSFGKSLPKSLSVSWFSKKVTALLSELQITNRPIKEDFCFDLESMKSEIDYEKVYDVIEQNRQSSKQYLKDAIGMAKK